MASTLGSRQAFAAFKNGPLRTTKRALPVNTFGNKSPVCVHSSNRNTTPATTSGPERQNHLLEASLAAVVASGVLAGSCLAADDVENAAQAVQAAKLASDILRPLFNIFTILYIVRVPMTWYPDIDGTKMPWLIAYAPTEPILSVTRKVVPLVSGVDVSPIVWVGLISFFNEILLGPQGLLTLIQARGGL